MKVKFLGTSHGVPMPGRYYQSIMIETKKGAYIIDAGAPVMDILINDGYDLTNLKGVFITHRHGDHLNGLNDLISLATWYYKDMRYDVYFPDLLSFVATKNYAEFLNPGKNPEYITYNLIGEGKFFDNGDVKITAIKTEHMDPSYAFLIEGEGKKVFVTGDMHQTLRDFPQMLNDTEVDLLISECAHFPAEALVEKLKETKARKGAVVHVYPTEKYDELREHLRDIPFELIFPYDGDIIEI